MDHRIPIVNREIAPFALVQGEYGADTYTFWFRKPQEFRKALSYYIRWENAEGEGSTQALDATGMQELRWTPLPIATAVPGLLKVQVYGLMPEPPETETAVIAMPTKEEAEPGSDAVAAQRLYDSLTATFQIPVTKKSTLRISGFDGLLDATVDCSTLEWMNAQESNPDAEAKDCATASVDATNGEFSYFMYIGARMAFKDGSSTPGIEPGDYILGMPMFGDDAMADKYLGKGYTVSITVTNPGSGKVAGVSLTAPARVRVVPSIHPAEQSDMDKDQFDVWLEQANQLLSETKGTKKAVDETSDKVADMARSIAGTSDDMRAALEEAKTARDEAVFARNGSVSDARTASTASAEASQAARDAEAARESARNSLARVQNGIDEAYSRLASLLGTKLDAADGLTVEVDENAGDLVFGQGITY